MFYKGIVKWPKINRFCRWKEQRPRKEEMWLFHSLFICIISLLVEEISSFDHGNIGNSGLTPLTRRPRRMTPQYPTPESPKNAGSLGKFMLVETPDGETNIDFLLVEKSGGKKSLVKLDEKIGNDERMKMPMGMIDKYQLPLNENMNYLKKLLKKFLVFSIHIVCPKACPITSDINDLVCGTDGKSYSNECWLRKACKEGLAVAHNGPCRGKYFMQCKKMLPNRIESRCYSICENIRRLSPIYREGSFEAKSSRNMLKRRTNVH